MPEIQTPAPGAASTPSPMGGAREPRLSLADWLVLCLVCEKPTYGRALVQLLSPEGSLGLVWCVPKAVIYRSLAHLADLRLIRGIGAQSSSLGPARALYRVTAPGRRAARAWLGRPVAHGRDIRSELLLKLSLLDRSGVEPYGLLQAQLGELLPTEAALEERLLSATGIEHTVALWRHQSISATIGFLRALTPSASPPDGG
jgi:DNA-binding PadR family transcriptional regulator